MTRHDRTPAGRSLLPLALLGLAVFWPGETFAQEAGDPPPPPHRVVIITENGVMAATDSSDAPMAEAFAMGPGMGAGMGMAEMGMPGGRGLKALDRDHDGKISKKEAKAAREEHFRRLDANHDGKVTADEVVAFHERQRRERQKKMAERMIARFDSDKNGIVTRKEFDTFFSQRFAKADADGDGVVTREEMARAARQRMQHLHREMQRLRREMRRMRMRMRMMNMHGDHDRDVEVIIDDDSH